MSPAPPSPGGGSWVPTPHLLLLPSRFSDLFSLAEEYEDSSTKPPKSRRKAALSSPRSRKSAAQPPNNEEESASSSASVRPLPRGGAGEVWDATPPPRVRTRTPNIPFSWHRRRKIPSPNRPSGKGKAPLPWARTATEGSASRPLRCPLALPHCHRSHRRDEENSRPPPETPTGTGYPPPQDPATESELLHQHPPHLTF